MRRTIKKKLFFYLQEIAALKVVRIYLIAPQVIDGEFLFLGSDDYPAVEVSLLTQILGCEVKEAESWTSQQCVDISKHPEEKYILDLKPLEKKFEKNILDFEIKRKAIDSVKMYFNQKIWGFWSMLSQKKNSTENIEWSGLVNNDTAKLRNYFQIKIAGMSN